MSVRRKEKIPFSFIFMFYTFIMYITFLSYYYLKTEGYAVIYTGANDGEVLNGYGRPSPRR